MCSLDHALPRTASASLNEQKMSPADLAEKAADDFLSMDSSLRPSAEFAVN